MKYFNMQLIHFLSGIYAAKPESLNLNQTFPTISNLEKEYGSIVWGLLKTRKDKINTHLRRSKLISYAGGMEELIGKLSSSIKNDIHLNHEVLKVERKRNMWKLTYNHKTSCLRKFLIRLYQLYHLTKLIRLNGRTS